MLVIMDNLRSHHLKEAEELLRQNEITLLYLLPYSPDLNPIEKNVVKDEIVPPQVEGSRKRSAAGCY
ncbi:MAG: transposase [Oscillospiraceae bacterium]|nr:transposase [Oscillospiraceae bacterium]